MPNANGLHRHELALESHEDRLQRVEDGLSEVAVELGKLSTAQEYVAEQLGDNTKLILDKLEKIDMKFMGIESRVTPLEQFDASQKKVLGLGKTLIIAAGTAFFAGLGAWLFSLISSHGL